MEDPFSHPSENEQTQAAVGSAGRMAASAASGLPNDGGTVAVEVPTAVDRSSSPRQVIRGESSWTEVIDKDGERYAVVLGGRYPKLVHLPQPMPNGRGDAALVDYLNCVFPFSSSFDLRTAFNGLFEVLGEAFAPAVDRKKGFFGYRRSFSLGDSGAILAFGGNADTGILSLCGEACHCVADWTALVSYLQGELGAHITRWDGAVDDCTGTHSVDEAVERYLAGQFCAGGRKPSINQKGNWIEPDGSGRTFYVGRRENGKLLRVYEKGMQLGIPWHPWVRWEVELHNVDRVIPWDAVLEPGKYVAGAFPKALGWVSEKQSRIRTLQKTSSIGYEALTHWASVAYGKQIDVMLRVEGSPEKVVEKLRRDGFPSRLDLPSIPGHGRVLPSCER